jgi:hypothetical protein
MLVGKQKNGWVALALWWRQKFLQILLELQLPFACLRPTKLAGVGIGEWLKYSPKFLVVKLLFVLVPCVDLV